MEIRLVILTYFLTTALPAYACLTKKPLTQEQLNKADVLFIGQAATIGVPVCSGTCTGKEKGYHTILFNVERVLKGKGIGKTVEVYWQNGTFGEVDDIGAFHKKYGVHNKVGIILPETLKRHFRCEPRRATSGTGKVLTVNTCSIDLPLPIQPESGSQFDRPWIISGVCSDAYIQNADDQ